MGLKAESLEEQLKVAVDQKIKWRGLYEAQKAKAANNALWLEAHRRLAKEKQCEDIDRLLEILKEIEAERE